MKESTINKIKFVLLRVLLGLVVLVTFLVVSIFVLKFFVFTITAMGVLLIAFVIGGLTLELLK